MARRPAGTSPRALARRVTASTPIQVQLKIELRRIQPLVWRRILVPESLTLAQLHVTLLYAMGWQGGYMHEYEIARVRYGQPDPEWPSSEPIHDERKYRLKPLIDTGLHRFTYLYDLGDHWEHEIRVEDMVPPKAGIPPVVCLAGANACPPEDVGGEPGYAEFLASLADPAHPEHEHMKKWIGGSFDPTAFDIAEANERLADIKI